MEDSVAVNVAVAKGLLWCVVKGNRVSSVYINGRVHTLPFAHKGIAERKKSERESSNSRVRLHLSNRSKVEGKVNFLTS